MDMAFIDNISLCKLGGEDGSNPEFVGSFPEAIGDEAELISKTMPYGISPGTYRSDKIEGMNIFSYTFKIKNENEGVRDDLASISVIVSDKKVIVDQMEILFKEIMKVLDESGELHTLRSSTLLQMMERIYNGVNKSDKIKIDTVSVDVPQIIKKKKLNILKKDLTAFKGVF